MTPSRPPQSAAPVVVAVVCAAAVLAGLALALFWKVEEPATWPTPDGPPAGPPPGAAIPAVNGPPGPHWAEGNEPAPPPDGPRVGEGMRPPPARPAAGPVSRSK